MKILLVLDHSGFFSYISSTMASLSQAGAEVKVITKLGPKGDEKYQQFMLDTTAEYDRASCEFTLRKRKDSWQHRIQALRGLFDYAVYFRRQHTSPQLAARREDRCPRVLRPPARTSASRAVLSRDESLRLYRRAAALLPADRRIASQIAAENPDVVVGCPFISPMCWDVEYLRAAQSLNIPTAASIASWDYFSTKGTFHLMTDSVLVWNERLAREAEILHAVPADRIMRSGAPVFDPYFEAKPSLDRDRFCSEVGIDPTQPYVVYLGSSENIIGDETDFVRVLARELRKQSNTGHLQVLVRPHPRNGAPWERFNEEDVTVFPRFPEPPDLQAPRDDYFNTLGHAIAAVGINTTAFIEAAIAGLPCLSVVNERHRSGQLELGHFRHLLESDFIEMAPDTRTLVQALREILDGNDRRTPARQRFVESFLRPSGVSLRAGDTMAEAIVATAHAGRRPAEAILDRGDRSGGTPSAAAPAQVRP